MTLTSQLDELLIALRQTHARLLAPMDHQQLLLPNDPEIFVEDVLHYVMDEWRSDLLKEGHVLEEVTSWKDPVNHYPRFELRVNGGATLDLLFSGSYPETLFLHVGKTMANKNQFSDAQSVCVPLRVSNDPNALLFSVLGGLKEFAKA
ncbi:MAG: hypothetical protein JST38_18045 [Bacteroidetes bacterium]|nr:hypothetical protein [Bacteroidota bacterium]MBS1942772.1 hypothetical protein [Bacteroidota bacterium]